MQSLYIVYDPLTKKIIRNVTEPPTLADGEAMQETTRETHREDIGRIQNGPGAGDLATVETADAARAAAIEFFDWFHGPSHGAKQADMLPTPCSPTGANPPTHFFCWWRAPKEEIDAGIKYAADHGKPNTIQHAATKEEFLERFGLKVIK